MGDDERAGDVDPGQGLQQDHAEANALKGVQRSEPEPERPSDQGARHGPTRPWHVLPDVGRSPEHLTPSGRAETHGEDGDDPRVVFGQDTKDPEQTGPDDNEEQNDEQ